MRRIVSSVFLVTVLVSSSLSQVHIREKVRIMPVPSFQKTASESPMPPLFEIDSTFYGPPLYGANVIGEIDGEINVTFTFSTTISGTQSGSTQYRLQELPPFSVFSPIHFTTSLPPGGSGTFSGSFTRYPGFVGFCFGVQGFGFLFPTTVSLNATTDTVTFLYEYDLLPDYLSLSGRVVLSGRRVSSGMDHFEVIVDPDTVRQTDTAKVYVQAKDATGNDVDIDNGTLLDFSLEEGSQAAHISTSDDQLTGIRYGNVKKGSETVVKLVARPAPVPLPAIALASISKSSRAEEPSDSITKVLIRVIKQTESDKKGEMFAYIRRLLILFIQDHSPWSIWPILPVGPENNVDGYSPRRSFVIQLRDGFGQPLSGFLVKINSSYEKLTGGHNHNNPPMRSALQGMFYGSGRSGNPLILNSNVEGKVSVDSMLASEISGSYLITAVAEADTTAKDTVNLVVGVPGLLRFVGSGSYTLTGSLHAHPDNHFVISKTATDSLISTANTFATQRWNSTGRMRINEISLDWGGLFDKDSNWIKPHKYHRVGRSVDIENIVMRDTTAPFIIDGEHVMRTVRVANSDWLDNFTQLVRRHGWHFLDEHQVIPNPDGRILYPHFEWKGN